MFLIKMNTWCKLFARPSEIFDHSCCQVLELLFDEIFKDFWFDQDLQVVQELQRGPGLCPKKEAPQTDVYNLSPYGIFLQACSSLNHLPGSQSWVSNCLIKLFFKIHWQVQKCRSLWYTHFPNPLMSSPFIFLCFLVLSCLFFSLALGSAE